MDKLQVGKSVHRLALEQARELRLNASLKGDYRCHDLQYFENFYLRISKLSISRPCQEYAV